ncbi:mechanosensitive ion channel family protein [Vogesella sp. LIG4]|uniref:mechanosensitive ion channel family protein n=1 Tax=Vogesella sp. LIG4 TaxID=1192162 RepID=UPI00081FF6BA|nr:mechanosensitive ion channel family protein [Vogesella sp. LIG4]SCK23706.1 Small-conductance mechanosensitive channel [Vogesella sp. LIG4]
MPAWLAELLHLYGTALAHSGVLIVVLLLVHASILRTIAANQQVPVEVRRRWMVNVRNVMLIIGMGGLVVIWAQELQTIALSMVAFTAALVVATKELLMCLGGGLVRSLGNTYQLGDIIEIGTLRGRVTDITMLSTSVLEIGPRHDAHQITGRMLSFPNSMLLTQAVARENFTGDYVMHILTIPLPYSLKPARAERLLQAIADEVCATHLEGARAHMAMLESKLLLDTPSVTPRISLQPASEKEYRIILRYAVPPRERQRVEQAILRRFLFDCFPENGSQPDTHADHH